MRTFGSVALTVAKPLLGVTVKRLAGSMMAPLPCVEVHAIVPKMGKWFVKWLLLVQGYAIYNQAGYPKRLCGDASLTSIVRVSDFEQSFLLLNMLRYFGAGKNVWALLHYIGDGVRTHRGDRVSGDPKGEMWSAKEF